MNRNEKNIKNVLIIDDDADFVAINREALEKAGFSVATAYNSQEGMEEIRKGRPDLILLDVMMTSPTEGFDFAYELKNSPDLSPIPVIMLTSMMDAPEFPGKFEYILGKDWPVAHFLTKPVKADLLVSEVKKLA